MKINKEVLVSFYFFLLAPFSSVPFVFFQLRKGIDKGVVFLVSTLLAMLSYRYIPHIVNDKARYIERYEVFKGYSFVELIKYYEFSLRPDYLFDFLIYVFAKIYVDVRVLFFLVTIFTVFSIFLFVKRVTSIIGQGFYFTIPTLLIVLFSISLPGLLSGIRFMFAGSLFIWFIYFFYFNKKYLIGLVFLFLAIATHFSYSLFMAAVLLAVTSHQVKVARVLLISSVFFLVMPKDILSSILGSLSVSAGYVNKVELYTGLDREASGNAQVLTGIKNIWYYVAFVYLATRKEVYDKRLYILICILLVSINFLYAVPIAFNRYLGFFKTVFALYLVYMFSAGYVRKLTFYMFLTLYLVGVLADILVLRVNFTESYDFLEMWSFFHFFYIEDDGYKFLD